MTTPPAAGRSALRGVASLAGIAPRALGALGRSGTLAPVRPDRMVRMVAAPLRLGAGPSALCAATAARWPEQEALIDERGALTYRDLDRRAEALAASLGAELSLQPGERLAIMCRNHRGFVEALLAGSRLGVDLLLLNTDFPGPQLAQVLERESPSAAVVDQEFERAFDDAGFEGWRVPAWCEDGDPDGAIESLIARGAGRPVPRSRRQGRLVLLTSGTTGTPKGAPRAPSLGALAGPLTTLLSQVPLRAREPMVVGPPLFHGFGLAYMGLAMALGGAIVVRRRFDAEATLAAIDEHRATSLVAVPVMLQRMLALPESTRRRHDTSSLRAVISAAAPLAGDMAEALMDTFGDIVHNLYGSTEGGFGAIATPQDLRAAPGTVGRPPHGVSVRILDDDGAELPQGEVGRVFIGGPMVFEGYTGGGGREMVDKLVSTGDLGHFDEAGLLFIDGREDDMIVSGGENVFAGEVEDALRRHPGVGDVAVVGVPDEEFGQRLRAYVVKDVEADVSADDLKSHLRSNLARYKVPRDFVFADEIPRNPTGKVKRSGLAEG